MIGFGYEFEFISVNISRTTLFHPGTIAAYKEIVEEVGTLKCLIPVELTESAAVNNVRIKALANELKEAGFSLHMDDFGSENVRRQGKILQR